MISTEAIIGLLAVLVAIPAALYARRALSPPKRQLDISVLQISPILTTAHDKLTVDYAGRRVDAPHVCNIRLQSTGKYAVSSAQFDSKRPIVLDFDVNIIENLGIESIPAGQAPPDVRISGTELHIHPSVIAPGQTVDLSLLTEGRPTPKISYHLIDTKVEFAVNRSEVQKLQHTQASRAKTLTSFALPIVVGLAGGIAVIGVTGAAIAYFTTPPLVERATLSTDVVDEDIYYPTNGELPESGPSSYGTHESADQCNSWAGWTKSEGAIPINNRILLTFGYTSDSPVEIVRVVPRVKGTFPIAGPARLRCSALQRHKEPADITIDLASQEASAASIGRIVRTGQGNVSPAFNLELKGATGVGYEYELEIEYSIDGKSRTSIVLGESSSGVNDQPLRTIFESSTEGKTYYDWSDSADKWVPVAPPK
jgi:hypothetical protein